MSKGFENVDTKTLEKIRDNLLKGIDKVSESLENGTFHKIGPKGTASPAQSGNLTLALLNGVTAELESRKRK